MSDLLIPSFLISDVSERLRSLIKNERCEQNTQVAHQKWATMSNLLKLLTKNEQPWANRSGCSQKMSDHEQIAFFWSKSLICSFFRQKQVIRSENQWVNSSPGFAQHIP